jgi:hypothetical protein
VDERPNILDYAPAPSAEKFSLRQALVIWAVALCPALVGWFYVSVIPLPPAPAGSPSSPAVANPAVGTGVTGGPAVTSLSPSPARTALMNRLENLSGPVFLACIIASVLIGLLGAKQRFGFAFFLGCMMGASSLWADQGMTILLSPIMLPFIPFWPLIALGGFIRRRFIEPR